MNITNGKIKSYKGETVLLNVTITPFEGNVSKNGTLYFNAKNKPDDVSPILQKTAVVTNNVATIEIEPADTNGLTVPLNLVWDMLFITSDLQQFIVSRRDENIWSIIKAVSL